MTATTEPPAQHHLRRFTEVREALTHPDLAQGLYDQGAQVMADSLITLHGAAHSARRALEFGVFTRKFFRNYESQVFPATLEPLLNRALTTGDIDLVQFGYQLSMNLTADFAGIDHDPDQAEQTNQLLELVKKFSEGATAVHSTRDRNRLRTEVALALTSFDIDFLEPSIQRRLALVEASEAGQAIELPNDIVTTLLRSRHSYPMNPALFRREIAFYLQAGAHSTANAVVRALHELFHWKGAGIDNARETESQLHTDLPFLQRCVHESLRLYPASPVAWRRAVSNLELTLANKTQCQVQQGDLVILDFEAANRDVEIFGNDANAFNPNRPLPARVWPFGLSFGYGAHACLGRDLDVGVLPKPNAANPATPIGIVPMLLKRLLTHNVRPHPHKPPIADQRTLRPLWSAYPTLIGAQQQ